MCRCGPPSQGAIELRADAASSAYYLIFMVVNHLTGSIEIHTVGYEIQNGDLSARLLLPVHPGLRSLASNVGYKAIGIFVLVPTVLLLAAIFRPEFDTTAPMVALGVVSTLIAALLQFLVGYSVALLSFWITRADAVMQLNSMFLLLLAGQIAPIALLPDGLRQAANVLPYRYMLSLPGELFTGTLNASAAAAGLGIQCLWLVAAWFLVRAVWRRGVYHYSAVGG
ncbi:MAG: ABC-2 family transporter protein [Chloroflexia bacterium]